MAGGAAFWLVKGIFQTGLPVEIIDKIMIVLLFVPLFLGFAGLLVALFQFLQALRNRRSNLPDPPIIVYFYISQLAFFSGCIFAYGLEIKDFEIASIFGALAFIFLAVKFIQIILDLLINIPKEKHQASFEHLFWVFLLIALISLPIDLSNNSAGSANWNAFAVFNTREFKLVLYQIIFEVSCPLLSFGLALALFTRFLSPFGFNHFFDRSLPQRTRLVLVFVGLTFLLPFGELCVPLWVYLKEKYWIYFEKQLELDHSEL